MQIACPNCSARYLVDPAAIGRAGRTVQCFRCGHKWRAHLPAEEMEAANEAVLTDTRPVPDFIIRPQNHDELVALPTIAPERGMPTWLKLTLGLLILAAVVGGVGYVLRDSLLGTPVAMSVPPAPPPAAPADPAPPSPIKPVTPASLLLENVHVDAVPGGRAIMARGDIVNSGAGDATPRRIRITFKDKDGKAIGERAFDLSPNRIAPQGRQPFRQQIDDPPAGAADIDVAVEPPG